MVCDPCHRDPGHATRFQASELGSALVLVLLLLIQHIA